MVFCLFSCDEQSPNQNTQPFYPDSYTPDSSQPVTTQPSVPSTNTPPTSSLEDTDPTNTPESTIPQTVAPLLPDEFSYSGEFRTDTGVYLNLRVKWFVNRTKGNDEVTVTANVYINYYSLFMGKRTLSVTLVDSTSQFDIAKFEVEENKKASTLLATSTKTLSCKELSELSFNIGASFKFSGVYGGTEIDVLNPKVSIKITKDGVTTIAND